jgi:hypothetical protein
MPDMVSEISQGQNYDFSVGDGGEVAANSVRVFRIIRSNPSQYVDIFDRCEVRIGDQHPREQGLYCRSASAVYESDTRLVILATFNYSVTPSASSSGGGESDGQQSPPETRPANWYTTTSLIEVPARTWARVLSTSGAYGSDTAVENPADDLYEGVTRLEPVVSIFIEQFVTNDPTEHNLYAGYTNDREERIGSMVIPRRCLMFRGVQTKPSVRNWGGEVKRGWDCSYEFLFKLNKGMAATQASDTLVEHNVGWDVLQPVYGFSVKAFAPPGNATQDPYAQPLKLKDNMAIDTPLALSPGTAAGEKVRGMIKINAADGVTTQRPSALPIPLNNDGTPRSPDASPSVLVYRYKVAPEADFGIFGLRLE